MGQFTFFDPGAPLDDHDHTPRARTSDPSTSHRAAHEIEPALGDLQRKAVATVRQWPDRTCQELADLLALRDPRTLNRRITEVARRGWIVSSGERRCSVTGRVARTWRVGVSGVGEIPRT